MKVPSILYVFEVDHDEDIRIGGSKGNLLSLGDPLPGAGAKCLLVPSAKGHQMHVIDTIWTVTAVEEIDDPEWDHSIDLRAKAVPNPTPWFEITDHLLAEGLAPVVGAPAWDFSSSGFYSGGTKVVHKPTIEVIYRLLGLT